MSPLKNLYMAFSYNENYRKMPVILECRYHYSSESSCFTFSAVKCFLITSFAVLRRCDFPASRKEGSGAFLALSKEPSLKPTYRGGGFRRTATSSKRRS